jgi:hypothetical protein
MRKVSLLPWVLVAFLVFQVLAASTARANPDADGLWATTAEFDAGTKSQPIPADGNYQIESITDNLRVGANAFSLASNQADTFSLGDSDADTWKWDLHSANSPTINVRQVTSGVLRVNITKSAAAAGAGVSSQYAYTGTVDMRIKATAIFITPPNPTMQVWIGQFNEQGECGTVSTGSTIDGVSYRASRTSSSNWVVTAFSCTNAAVSTIGGGADSLSFATPIWLRISGSSGSWTFYYSSDGSSWTQDEISNFAVAGNIYTSIANQINGAVAGQTSDLSFDDYDLVSASSVTYRTSGDWLSDNYLVGGTLKRVGFVLLNFTGISSTYAIDKVELYRNDVLREVFANDITTGTSKNLTVSEVIESGANVSVRIYLKGDGAGTATITRIQVFMVTLVNLVSTVSAYQIGAHSVILAGNVTYDAEPDGWLQIIFDFGTTPQAHERVNVGWVDGAGNFTILLYELDPSTVYYFHARVDGNVSGYADGDIMQFQTLGTGQDMTVIWILIIAILILIGLGLWVESIGGILLILAGIATIVLGLQVFTLFAEVLIAAMVGALGIFLIILGIMDVMNT